MRSRRNNIAAAHAVVVGAKNHVTTMGTMPEYGNAPELHAVFLTAPLACFEPHDEVADLYLTWNQRTAFRL